MRLEGEGCREAEQGWWGCGKELFPPSCAAVMRQSDMVNTARVALGTLAQDRPFHQPYQAPWHIKSAEQVVGWRWDLFCQHPFPPSSQADRRVRCLCPSHVCC